MSISKERVGIAREGYPIIGLVALSAVVFALLQCWFLSSLFLICTWFSVFFFRDPERVIPATLGVAVSPADGKIIKIAPSLNPMTQEECTIISIFMNVFNVHVNRMPVEGEIREIQYIEGAFFNASWDKASADNERCMYRIHSSTNEEWCMVQISGLIARRIVSRVSLGDSLSRGERFGLIRFGSRVDLYIPNQYVPSVTIGEKVFAGQSIIAKRA